MINHLQKALIAIVFLGLHSTTMAHDHSHHTGQAPVDAVQMSTQGKPVAQSQLQKALFSLEVFKSPTCGCCGDWIEKLENNNIAVTSYHPSDLNGVKNTLNIRPEYQSCHTAVSQEGFFFEGHVPVYLVKQFLAAPPKNAAGLSVPAMPVGSPGMEMGDRFQPYSVLLINEDGSASIYEEVKSLEQSLR